MKLTLLLGASLVALSVGSAPAGAVTFNFTGAATTYTIPTTGLYQIDAWGGQGGHSYSFGGLGAHVAGEFNFTAGLVLTIAVGGAGGNPSASGYGGGGGGGSFVVNNITPLMIAGGGGGAYTGNGGPGLATFGGSGTGGTGDGTVGGGGGGFSTDGQSSSGGKAFPLLTGGSGFYAGSGAGGFGGGGGAGAYGGGGGGGFNGGNGGGSGGFGGTSFNAGANQVNQSGVRSGNGLIEIVLLSATEDTTVPEPGSMALLAAGAAGLGALRRRRTED